MTPETGLSQQNGDLEAILASGRGVCFAPRGTSMWPTLQESKDKVEVEPISDRRLKRGEIVLYRRASGLLVLHRVVKVEGELLWMRGDNQFEMEGPLNRGCVLGVLSARVRMGKRIETDSLGWRTWSQAWTTALPLRKVVRTLRARGRNERCS